MGDDTLDSGGVTLDMSGIEDALLPKIICRRIRR